VVKRRPSAALFMLLFAALPACAAVIGIKDLIPGTEDDLIDSGSDGTPSPNDDGGGPSSPMDASDADAGALDCINDADALKDNPDHCGRCGHSCLGGGCEGGVCQPIAIATGQGTVGPVAIDGTHVYWSSFSTNTIARVVKTGGAIQPISQSPNVGNTRSIAVSAQHIYWGNDDFINTVVNRCPLTGCGAAVPEKIADADRPVGVALSATHVYWCDRNANVIQRRAFTGGAVELVGRAQGAGPWALAVDQQQAFWVGDFSGEAQSHYSDGGTYDIGLNGQSGRVITVDALNAYWGVQVDPGQPGRILRARRDGSQSGSAAQQLSVAGGEPLGMFLDGPTLYWTAQAPDGGTGGGVYSVPTAGGTATIHAGNQVLPRGIAVDDKAIYWGREGSIMKLAKP